MSFVKQGVVLTLGAPGDFDDVSVYDPTALERDGKIWLYYVGRDGARYRVGLAISEDGVTFVRQGVVLHLGEDGDFDDYYVAYPAALERNGKVYLYYTGYDGSKYRIGLAISADGVNFIRQGMVLPLGAGGTFDGAYIRSRAVLERDGKVWLYYTGNDGKNPRVGLAISEDGLTFIRFGVVLSLGTNSDFDDTGAYSPAVLERDGKVWLYYIGNDGSKTRIGLAISEDGINFIRLGAVLLLGADGDFDDSYFYPLAALERDDQIHLYYTSFDSSGFRIGLAISEDGL